MLERNLTLLTDLYELTMMQGYFKEKDHDKVVVFDVFYRANPCNNGYSIAKPAANIYLLIFPILQFVMIPLLCDNLSSKYPTTAMGGLIMIFLIICILYGIFILIFLLSQKWFKKIVFLISIAEILFLIILFKIYYPYYFLVLSHIEFMGSVISTVFVLYLYSGIKYVFKQSSL